MIDGAASEVAANRDAYYCGRRKSVVRTPADQWQFIAQLHHSRPDVVEELNLHHRLQPTRGHTGSAAYNVCLGQRRVEDAIGTKFALQARGQLEYAALALDQFLLEILVAAAVGNVLAKHHDTLVAGHLIAQSGVDQVGHGLRSDSFRVRRVADRRFSGERGGGWVKVGRVD